MEHLSFSPEPPSVRKTPPAGGVARKCQKGNGWHRAAMTEGVSFCHTAKNLCKNAVFRLLFVWADSILDVYAFFLAALRFPFSFFPFADRGPAAVMISRSTSASPCCRRPVWHWAWLPQPPSSRTATWCATWCCSRCRCMSCQVPRRPDRTDCRWSDPSRGTHQRPCGEQAGRSCMKGVFCRNVTQSLTNPVFLYTEHSATGTIFLLCRRLAITGKG